MMERETPMPLDADRAPGPALAEARAPCCTLCTRPDPDLRACRIALHAAPATGWTGATGCPVEIAASAEPPVCPDCLARLAAVISAPGLARRLVAQAEPAAQPAAQAVPHRSHLPHRPGLPHRSDLPHLPPVISERKRHDA